MKAKKPLLLAVLVVALLAVGLILPATASGQPQGKQPLAWVSYGGVNRPYPGALNQVAVSVQWYGGDDFRGSMTLQVIKAPGWPDPPSPIPPIPPAPRMIAMAGQGDFSVPAGEDDPVTDTNDFTFTASFDVRVWGENGWVTFEDGAELTCVYHDGGGPGSDSFSWDGNILGNPFSRSGSPPHGNIVVHIR